MVKTIDETLRKGECLTVINTTGTALVELGPQTISVANAVVSRTAVPQQNGVCKQKKVIQSQKKTTLKT